MTTDPLTIPADTPLREVCAEMRQRLMREALIMPSSWQADEPPVRPIGIFTTGDALDAAMQQQSQWLELPVVRFMAHPVLTVLDTETLSQAVDLMETLGIRRLPVMAQGTLVGLLRIEDALRARAEQLREMEKLLQQRAEEALQDPLTGLPNRRLFQEVLQREVPLHQRSRLPLGLLIVDIDFFKEVNDTYGHPAGDQLLQQLARRLRDTVRKADLVARIGGEEFAILAAVEDKNQLAHLGEKLRWAVASEPFLVKPCLPSANGTTHHIATAMDETQHPGATQYWLHITASVGAAMLSRLISGPAELVRRADVALYEAKRRGRNAVWLDGGTA